MPLLPTADGHLELLVRGSGLPVTVFAHGLGASIAETRPLASGVLGTRAFFAFRGHGASAAPETPWDYAALAGELRAVADHVGASRALGVSMGAGALLRLLVETPDRFERVVLFLPAVLDRRRTDAAMRRLAAMADLVDDRDVPGLAALLREELPAPVRDLPEVGPYVDQRARVLAGTPVSRALRMLPQVLPVDDRGELARVTAPVLVVGQQGDDVHPAAVAEQVAAALPNARLHVFSEAGAMWLARARLRELVAGFLNAGADSGSPAG